MQSAQYQPGQQLPGTVYRVVRHLATGGMGSVYDVEDVTVGKRYVLKTLHPQLIARQDLARRMEAEARTLAKLQHPNIVDVVTAGITSEEPRVPFYVMERLNGQNLRVVLEKKSALELAHCYRIAIDVLDALEHAHENAVIHRDVKPENIFLHRNANGTTITKLLDFGIMRLLDQKASHTHGKFIGTLRYASPEQIMGGTLGPATDIYSIGIVLYEMIAGRGPFDDVGDAYAIGAAHAQKPPPPLSRFARVPPVVEQLVMATLAKRAEDRPRDCFSIASELRRMRRDDEAAPRSATAVNVLSVVPATRPAPPPEMSGVAFAGTEAARAAPDAAVQPTETSASVLATLVDPTGTLRSGAVPAHDAPAPGYAATKASSPAARRAGEASPVSGPAPALASSPVTAISARVSAGGPGGVPAQMPSAGFAMPVVDGRPSAPPASLPARVAPAGGLIDRNAPTRAGGPYGATQRLAQNGTLLEDLHPVPAPAPVPDDAIRNALDERVSLEVPSINGTGPGVGDLVFPPIRTGEATGSTGSSTGPTSGEAATRPPEPRSFLPLVAAAVAGAALVGGVFWLATHSAKFSAFTRSTSASPVASPVASTMIAPTAELHAEGSAEPKPNAASTPNVAPGAVTPAGAVAGLGAHEPAGEVTAGSRSSDPQRSVVAVTTGTPSTKQAPAVVGKPQARQVSTQGGPIGNTPAHPGTAPTAAVAAAPTAPTAPAPAPAPRADPTKRPSKDMKPEDVGF